MADVSILPNNYEITCILKDEEDSKEVGRILKKNKAVILDERPLVKVQLAYSIQKLNQAYLGYFLFGLDPEFVPALSAELGLEKNIVRHLINKASSRDGRASDKKRRSTFERERVGARALKETEKMFEPVLTNEAIQEKIEEILK
ncbi:MAG: 30S ribosomal protein S6 [Patescibacteria group bacterium]